MRREDVPAGLMKLLAGQDLYCNISWQSYGADDQRQQTRDLSDDHTEAVSSHVHGTEDGHYLLLDLDLPAYLVQSSTSGHSHLYVKTNQPIPWADLQLLLRALAVCGVIEPGYVSASIDRESTHLRLPWVDKTPKPDPVVPDAVAVQS